MSELSIQELEWRITAKTSEWMDLIGSDHHKDRDCHFYIERIWSYGNAPYWQVSHHGYICDKRLEQRRPTYQAALEAVLAYIEELYAQHKRDLEDSDA